MVKRKHLTVKYKISYTSRKRVWRTLGQAFTSHLYNCAYWYTPVFRCPISIQGQVKTLWLSIWEDVGHAGGCLTSFRYASYVWREAHFPVSLAEQGRHVTWAQPIRCFHLGCCFWKQRAGGGWKWAAETESRSVEYQFASTRAPSLFLSPKILNYKSNTYPLQP